MLSRRRSFMAWICTLFSAGCSVSVEPIVVADGCPQQPARGTSRLEATSANLLDDFEHEGASLPRRGGRDGMWVSASDGSSDEVEWSVSEHCAARGQRAGHFVGRGLSGWGATWTALLRTSTGSTTTYDASAYGGISFWAAQGTQMAAPLSVPVGVTNPAPEGGSSRVGCASCLDYYATDISLDHHWRRFELRFSDLVQLDNGNPTAALRIDEIVGLTFWPEGDFDIWVDDVRFEP